MTNSAITITSPDQDGTQHFIVNGQIRYAIYVVDSIRGTRYAARPYGHIGRRLMTTDRAEAFAHCVYMVELTN